MSKYNTQNNNIKDKRRYEEEFNVYVYGSVARGL